MRLAVLGRTPTIPSSARARGPRSAPALCQVSALASSPGIARDPRHPAALRSAPAPTRGAFNATSTPAAPPAFLLAAKATTSTMTSMPSGANEPPVAVFTTSACAFCKRAKQILKDQGVEFREVDTSSSPELLQALKESTGRRTVPQVFVGGELVGGADELDALIKDNGLSDAIARSTGRGALPAEIQSMVDAAGTSASSAPLGAGTLAGGRIAELIAVEESLRASGKTGLPLSDVPKGLFQGKLRGVFTGASLVDRLASDGTPRADAVALASELCSAGLVAPAQPRAAAASVDGPALFRFQGDVPKYGGPLNEVGPSGVRSGLSATEVAELMRGQVVELYDEYLSDDGNAVDYKAMATAPAFRKFARTTSALRDVDVAALSREERIAFFCNVYNALVVHATAARGAPEGLLGRLGFFDSITYVIGGQLYSANDVEHGVLRGNAVSPAAAATLIGLPKFAPRTFKAGDPRLGCIVDPVDPRIHFALVCGAKSCPPIRVYSADGLESQLGDAAAAFCEGEVAVVGGGKEVEASKIFKWYGGDFVAAAAARAGGGKQGPNVLLEEIAAFLPKDQAAPLKKLLAVAGGEPVPIKYREYDWSINQKK